MSRVRNILFFILVLTTTVIRLFVLCDTGSCHEGEKSSPRYISLAPSTTEILFALGLDKEIVGVSTFCDYPPQARHKRKVGSFSSPSIETILYLRPDYIFCTGLEQAPAIEVLRRLGLAVFVCDPAGTKELFDSIAQIAMIVGRETEGKELINKMRSEIMTVARKSENIPDETKLRVFIEIWHEPLMTAGKGSFVDELIGLAGGINIAHNTIRPYSNYSAEMVIKSNPQVIILTYMDKESPLKLVENRFGWKGIEAIRKRRVFNDISSSLLLRPGPRVGEGLKAVYEKLYGKTD